MPNELEPTLDRIPPTNDRGEHGDNPPVTMLAGNGMPKPPCVLNGRFHLERILGQGGMAVVYLATDLDNQRQVALKMMKATLGGTARNRFIREFGAVVSMKHPHCVDVMEYGESPHGPYFTMELFPGQPITCLIGRDLTVILDALYQAAAALDFVHSRRIVHRDVKPSNILVRTGTLADGRLPCNVKLTDFGLARFQYSPASISAETGFAGTLQYCSPEQITNDALDHRADLYSFGIVCYELLTGRYPFLNAQRAASVQALWRAQLREIPPSVRLVAPHVPPRLADAVMHMLAKETHDRPTSTLPLRAAIAEYLGLPPEEDASNEATVPLGLPSVMIGRGPEIERLDTLLPLAINPSPATRRMGPERTLPSLVVITGDPGIGKSRLLRQGLRTALGEGAHVYEGRCLEGNVAPFQPFVEVLQTLLAEQRVHDRRRPGVSSAEAPSTAEKIAASTLFQADPAIDLRATIDNYSPELLRIAPELRARLRGDAFRQKDLVHETNYIFRAVAAFFIEAATIQPTCICLEDLQWADASTLQLLRHLAGGLSRSRERSVTHSEPFSRLVICCTARSGHDHVDALLAELQRHQQATVIPLTLLSDAECRELAADRLDCQPAQVADELMASLAQACQGNPFFICETIRQWQVTEAIGWLADQWRFSPREAGATTAVPDSVRDTLRRRLQGLPDHSRQVITMSAVIGAVVDVDLLSGALPELQQFEFLDAMDDLLHRRILVEIGARLQFGHDLLRELTLDSLTALRRQSMHARVASLLEQRREQGRSVPSALLAAHCLAAGLLDQGRTYSLEAGRQALEAYALSDAVTHLTAARGAASHETPAETRYEILNLLGTALAASARPREALACYDECLQLTRDPLLRGQTYCEMVEAHRKLGELDTASETADRALREVGYRPQPSTMWLPLSTWWSMLSVHGLPQWFVRRTTRSDVRPRAAVAHRVYQRLGSLICDVNMWRYPHASLMQLRYARRAGDPRVLTIAYARYAWSNAVSSLGIAAKWSLKRASRYARVAGDTDLQAIAEAYSGVERFHAGHLVEAEQHLRCARTVLERQGDSYDLLFVNHQLRHTHSIWGNAVEELTYADAELALAGATGYWTGIAWGHYGRATALARIGKLAEARQAMQDSWDALKDRRSAISAAIARAIHGFVLLQCSDYQGADELLTEAARSMPREFILVEYSVWAYPLLAEAILGPHWIAVRHDANTRRAWRMSRLGRFWGWRFPNLRPHVYRISGRAAAARGRTRVANKYFAKAIRSAEAIGAEYDLARALLDQAAVTQNDGTALRARAKTILERIGATIPEAERWQLEETEESRVAPEPAVA